MLANMNYVYNISIKSHLTNFPIDKFLFKMNLDRGSVDPCEDRTEKLTCGLF